MIDGLRNGSIAGQTSGYAVVLVLSILFLWLRPQGLFGRR